jgi:hypothetical protein
MQHDVPPQAIVTMDDRILAVLNLRCDSPCWFRLVIVIPVSALYPFVAFGVENREVDAVAKLRRPSIIIAVIVSL